MTTLPGARRRDIPTLVPSPIALLIAAAARRGASPRLPLSRRKPAPGQRQRRAAPLPPVPAEERARLADWWDLQPKVELPVSRRRREGR